MQVALIGGTGDLGYGLAVRLASAGVKVIIGSRDPEKALAAAARATAATGRPVSGAGNVEAAVEADLVVLAVPAAAREATVAVIRPAVEGKVVVDATVSLAPGDPTRVVLPPGGSAALASAAQLGSGVRVVAALQTISGKLLSNLERPIEGDVLICGDSGEAKAVVAGLVEAIGARPLDAGPLENSGTLERLTALIIGMNKRYKRRHIGLSFTGLPVQAKGDWA